MFKPKAEKIYVSVIIVQGRGDFPFDMLRYDNCVPYSSGDAASLTYNDREVRQIKLIRYSRNPDGCTVARWNSFLWGVISEENL